MSAGLVVADREVCDFFTSCVGVRAQRYEPAGHATDVSPEELLMAPRRAQERARVARVHETLLRVPVAERGVLEAVYARVGGSGLGGVEVERGGLLSIALSPSWGHGTLLRLALVSSIVRTAFLGRWPDRAVTGGAVVRFLADEAGRGGKAAVFFGKVRTECEAVRDEALGAYEVERRARRSVRLLAVEARLRGEES